MLYLTTVLKIDSGIAGTIVALTLISEAVSAIIIGGASDRSTSPKGRRRPYIIISSIVLSLCLVISFTAFDFPDTVKIIYYTFFGIVMRGAFSAYYTTYVAFGAEILTDYDQRTRMRSICKLFSTAGNLIGYVLPLWIVGLLTRLNYSEAAGWSVAAMLVALITFFTAFICWKNTAPYDSVQSPVEKNTTSFKDILQTYLELFKLKALDVYLIYKSVYNFAFTFITNTMLFFMLYKLGLSEGIASTTYMIGIIVSFVSIPLINSLGIRLGKSACSKVILIACSIISIILYFVGVDNLYMAILYICVFNMANSTFWQLSYPMVYDICEADEFCFGKRREGDITAIQVLIPTLSSALASQVLGIALSKIGFDSTLGVQTASVCFSLNRIFILIPNILMLLSAASLSFFPLNKKIHRRLLTAIEKEKDGTLDTEEEKFLDKKMRF